MSHREHLELLVRSEELAAQSLTELEGMRTEGRVLRVWLEWLQTAGDGGLSPCEAAVLSQFNGQPRACAELAGDRNVNGVMLSRLEKSGLLTRVQRGIYVRTEVNCCASSGHCRVEK